MQNRLKLIRKSTGLNQNNFADALGVSVSNISSYESGRRNPSDAFISLVCSKYGINEEWLRDGTGDMFRLPDDETAALVSDLLEDADDDFYEMVLDVVRTYQQLQPESKEVLKNFCCQLADNIKNRKDN